MEVCLGTLLTNPESSACLMIMAVWSSLHFFLSALASTSSASSCLSQHRESVREARTEAKAERSVESLAILLMDCFVTFCNIATSSTGEVLGRGGKEVGQASDSEAYSLVLVLSSLSCDMVGSNAAAGSECS